MKPPARPRSARGLLLVEAVLAAVVIATSLVFVSRGLSGQLNAVRSIEQYQILAGLGQGKLDELETRVINGLPLGAPELSGTFEAPNEEYRWELDSEPRPDLATEEGLSLASDVTLTVSRLSGRPASLSLRTVWPAEWLAR